MLHVLDVMSWTELELLPDPDWTEVLLGCGGLVSVGLSEGKSHDANMTSTKVTQTAIWI